MKSVALALSAACLAVVAIVATRAILSDSGGAQSAGRVPSAATLGTAAVTDPEVDAEMRAWHRALAAATRRRRPCGSGANRGQHSIVAQDPDVRLEPPLDPRPDRGSARRVVSGPGWRPLAERQPLHQQGRRRGAGRLQRPSSFGQASPTATTPILAPNS